MEKHCIKCGKQHNGTKATCRSCREKKYSGTTREFLCECGRKCTTKESLRHRCYKCHPRRKKKPQEPKARPEFGLNVGDMVDQAMRRNNG